ncbi:hypothetical protein PG993_005597 [Apiospora rasikravindrae]|uniref:Peptidase metallopeptidase domain-containing protein n=1 Tax=Apiospora rasikravindrae TaxID=990691 RepID=A0ABR1TIS0_9PEZI
MQPDQAWLCFLSELFRSTVSAIISCTTAGLVGAVEFDFEAAGNFYNRFRSLFLSSSLPLFYDDPILHPLVQVELNYNSGSWEISILATIFGTGDFFYSGPTKFRNTGLLDCRLGIQDYHGRAVSLGRRYHKPVITSLKHNGFTVSQVDLGLIDQRLHAQVTIAVHAGNDIWQADEVSSLERVNHAQLSIGLEANDTSNPSFDALEPAPRQLLRQTDRTKGETTFIDTVKDTDIAEGEATIIKFSCSTEPVLQDHLGLRLGWDDKICIWISKATLKYRIDPTSLSNTDLCHIQASLVQAIFQWKGAGVNFVEASPEEGVDFVVRYTMGQGYLAHAFFPGDIDCVLKVYPYALNSEHSGALAGILAHELGHIMGLRHEYVRETEAESHAFLQRAKLKCTVERPACLFGDENPLSVMNAYCKGQRVHAQDIAEVKKLYEHDGHMYRGMDIVRYRPRTMQRTSPHIGTNGL